MISLANSNITEEVRKNVNACLDDNRIGQGRFNKEFEQGVAEYMGVKHGIVVNNGTMADMVALGALKAKYPGKTEVIVPAYTFIAQTNAIFMNGLTPVFVDVVDDYQIDSGNIESKITDKTLCIFAVHLFGRSCEILQLKKIADHHGIGLVEDCCEAFGGTISKWAENGKDILSRKLGTIGDFGTFSFFPSHTITTGEGGMIITNDDELAALARQVSNHGRRGDDILNKFHFDVFGYNGKMSNVLAAIGCAILPTADEVISKRRANVALYNQLLGKDWYASSPHCYPVRYESMEKRDETLKRLWENGVEARKAFSSLPTQENVYKHLGYKLGDFPKAEYFGEHVLFTPVHQGLTEDDIKFICSLL